MYYISHERIVATAVAQTATALTIPGAATMALIQVDTGGLRYRMDGGVATNALGLRLTNNLPPTQVGIEELQQISFVREGLVDVGLNVSYLSARNV